MQAQTEDVRKNNWRVLLSILMAIVLAASMVPIAPSQADAATKTKTYVYDYMYGTYHNEYAIGCKKYDRYGHAKQIDVVSVDKGVTLTLKNNKTEPYMLTTWLFFIKSYLEDMNVIPKPVGASIYTKYQPYLLSGKRLSSKKYDAFDYYSSPKSKNGFGLALLKSGAKTSVVDIFGKDGKKLQTINIKGKISYLSCCKISGKSYLEATFRNGTTINYLLKNGKFISIKNKPKEKYLGYPQLKTKSITQETEDGTETLEQYYFIKGGHRYNLPLGRYYREVDGIGAFCTEKNKLYIYSYFGKLVKTIKLSSSKRNSITINKSSVPGIWVISNKGKCLGAYNSKFNLVSKSKARDYLEASDAGRIGKTRAYALSFSVSGNSGSNISQVRSIQSMYFVNKNMVPIKKGKYTLVGVRSLYPDDGLITSFVSYKLSKNHQAYIAKDSKNRIGIVDSKGRALTRFIYDNYDVTTPQKYILLGKGKKWSIIRVDSLK